MRGLGVALLLSLLPLACRGPAAAPPPPKAVHASAPPPPVTTGWSYEVNASAHGDTLDVVATFPPGTTAELAVGDDADPFVRDVVVDANGQRSTIAESRGQWHAPQCSAGCRVTYRFALREAAKESRERSVAEPHGDEAIESPPSSWLLRPIDAAPGIPFRFHVTSAPGEAFASGVFPVAGVADTYEGFTGNGFDLPYAAFGRIRRIPLADGHVEVAMFPGAFKREDTVLEWISRSAKAVEAFYGRFPIARVLVLVQPTPGRRVGFGVTMGSSGASIMVPVGEDVQVQALRDDWMLVHEMIHTALPDVSRQHHWLEEGLATYAEPIARARAGLVTPNDLWRDWVLGMPKGEPAAGDQGLDRTHTWGRTYWGGALFCLEADVAIRERTGGKRSLVDALRAIVNQGGNIAVSWPVEKVLDVGDAATGVPVLRETYARMATAPGAVDLEALWKRLGVHLERGVVTYDDAAPARGGPAIDHRHSMTKDVTRLASEPLRAAWPFDESATYAVYIDLNRASGAAVDLFDGLVPALTELARRAESDDQRFALETVVSAAREIAVGGDARGRLVLARLDRAIASDPENTARALIGKRALAVRMRGDVVLVGPESLVEAALASDGTRGAALAMLAMAGDTRVAFAAAVRGIHGTGTVESTRDHLVVRADIAIDDEAARAVFRNQLQAVTTAPPPPASADAHTTSLLRLAKGIAPVPTERGAAVTFTIDGPPLQQASDVSLLAAAAQQGVRMYLRSTKLVEAQVALPIIARSCAELWEREGRAGLRSFPAVPAVMPCGAPHTPQAGDWDAWEPLYFSYPSRHWFQLEVRASAGGTSAEVLATSDLGGDGRITRCRVGLSVDADACMVHVRAYEQDDPGEPILPLIPR